MTSGFVVCAGAVVSPAAGRAGGVVGFERHAARQARGAVGVAGGGLVALARPALLASGGFSVSWETEMRMDLARSRSMDGVPGDFAFREGKGRKGPGLGSGVEAAMKAKVKSLGKTLKSLLRVKS